MTETNLKNDMTDPNSDGKIVHFRTGFKVLFARLSTWTSLHIFLDGVIVSFENNDESLNLTDLAI